MYFVLWYTDYSIQFDLKPNEKLEGLKNRMKIKKELESCRDGLFVFIKWLAFSCMIGMIVGFVAVLFHHGIEGATKLREHFPWLLYLLPIGGVVIIWIYNIAGMKNHSGTNLVLSAVRSNEKLSLKTAPLIFLSTILTHLFGGSSGREGAALQLGGSISSKIGRIMNVNDKDGRIITMCGMSAAFSALFGTPVTAVVFSMEVVSVGVMYYSAIVPCIISAVIALSVAGLLHVPATQFAVLGIPDMNLMTLASVVAMGIACAGISILFCVAMEKTGDYYEKKFQNLYLRAIVGGSIVILVTILIGTRDYNGAGMEVITHAFVGDSKKLAFLFKIILTALTLRAGFKGGEIVPAFFTGATFGNMFGSMIGLNPSFGAGLGLLAVFCGVTNCPITSFILSVELFGAEGFIFYAIACSVSYMLSGYFGLYKEQKIMYSKLSPEFIDTKTN